VNKPNDALLSPTPAPVSILLVDDDEGQLALQVEILKEIENCRILAALSGERALQLIRQYPLDLVLLDKCLPDIDGDEVCRIVRQEYNYHLLPIIMVTGLGNSEHLRSSLARGANDYVKKPFNPIELLSRAKAALERKQLVDQLDNAESVLFTLAKTVEARDPTTGEHCNRLIKTSLILGRELGLDERAIDALKKGAILHDIGKIAIPDEILLKPAPLNEDEWIIMQRHAEIGANLCIQLNGIRDAVPIIRHHHERWDGTGYPDHLHGEDIPLVARIFQCADIYDALRHRRSYCDAIPVDEIIRIFQQELDNGWRDPNVGEVFLRLLRESPDRFDQY